MFMYNPIGKTLLEIHKDCGSNRGGYVVFVLQHDKDITGVRLDEDISVGLILRKYPQYADYKVKYENDFYGTVVLRIWKGGAK